MKLTSKRQFISAILMAMALASPMAIAETPATTPVSWLFVQEAGGGTITGPDDQHLTLTLTHLRNHVTAFTDRPIRSTTAYPNAMFFQKYPKMFAADAPNAVLNYSNAHSIQPTSLVLTLSNPRYDAKHKTVKFHAVRVKATAKVLHKGAPYTAPTVHALKTQAVFGKASLFIDSVIATTYQIGDPGPAGGIVFYLTDASGEHGMEAAPVDQSVVGIQWGCDGTNLGGTSTAYGTGSANTVHINELCRTQTAASIAASYSLNGVSDWFLPSKEELNILNNQLNVVGGFAIDGYWSSSENGSGNAWSQDFFNSQQWSTNKNYTLPVRAVRAF
jgi:hypothetical protein